MHNHFDNNSQRQFWKNTKGFLEQCFVFVPSDNIKAEALSEESSDNKYVAVKMKEIQVLRSGKIRVTFDGYHGSAEYGIIRLSKNGTMVEQYSPYILGGFTWYTATKDVDVKTGDLIQLYISSFDGESHSVRNLRLKWDTVRANDVQKWS